MMDVEMRLSSGAVCVIPGWRMGEAASWRAGSTLGLLNFTGLLFTLVPFWRTISSHEPA